jgi:hypothetical protein
MGLLDELRDAAVGRPRHVLGTAATPAVVVEAMVLQRHAGAWSAGNGPRHDGRIGPLHAIVCGRGTLGNGRISLSFHDAGHVRWNARAPSARIPRADESGLRLSATLISIESGDSSRADKLLPLVYDELWRWRPTLAVRQSTKNREPFLDETIRPRIHGDLATVIRDLDSPSVVVGGVADHVSALFDMGQMVAPQKSVEQMKVALGRCPRQR